MSTLNLIRPDLATLETYLINDQTNDCLLHANELPWCPPIMTNTIETIQFNRYPTLAPKKQLQMVLANCYDINPNELLLTRGSDEGIDLLMRLFLRPGVDSIMQCPPTFSMYAFFARLQQAFVINCPLQENDAGFYLDRKSMTACWQPNCKLIILCRPNNPTGELIDLETIACLCKQYANQSMIVVDEAYIEFSEEQSATSLINQFDNLMVLRTLSKAYGLAGLRLGAVIAQATLIKSLNKLCAPFPLSSAVIELALNALQNKTWFTTTQQRIKQLRADLAKKLETLSWIEKVYPSAANFLLIKTPYATSLAIWFQQHRIVIRAFSDNPQLKNYLRITVGNDTQNTQLLAALAAFVGGDS